MIKYALRDLRGNRVMTAVIGIQTFVVFVTLICMMSVVMFRYDQYHDISGLISGDGQVLRLTGMAETPQWHRILSGIAEENAQFIGPSDFNKNYTDARGLYWNYLGAYYKEPKFFVVKDDIREHLASQGVDFEASYFFPKIEGLVFVRFDEGTTTEQKAEFYENSRKRCQMVERNTFETFRHDGKKYVYEQLKVMIPVILAVILLTLISTASNAAIMVRTNLKKY